MRLAFCYNTYRNTPVGDFYHGIAESVKIVSDTVVLFYYSLFGDFNSR